MHATPYSQVGSLSPSGAVIAIMHPIDVLEARGGVARWQGLADAGVLRRSLGAAIAANEVVRAGRGVYALPRTHPVHVAAVLAGGYVSHTSAAAFWGMDLVDLPGAHVAVSENRSRIAAIDAIVHRVSLGPTDTVCAPIPVIAPLRTVVDCARTLPVHEALVIVDSALRKGIVDERNLREFVRLTRGPGSRRARWVLLAASGLAESPGESLARYIFMTDKRLPEPILQHEIRRDGHLVARVDLAVVQWRGRPVRLAIEHDGFAYHSDRGAYRKDRLRRNAIERVGWALLELTYEDVLYNRSRCADLIFATLQERWQADRAS
ncbi:MAG TPA: type IV toxin-antitoxin system AbiEi family antitoxin domain-containing protein [Actinomycetes bacterium]